MFYDPLIKDINWWGSVSASGDRMRIVEIKHTTFSTKFLTYSSVRNIYIKKNHFWKL